MNYILIEQEQNKLTLKFEQTSKSVDKIYIKNEYQSLTFLPSSHDANYFEIDLINVLHTFEHYSGTKIYVIIEESNDIITTQRSINVKKDHLKVINLAPINQRGLYINPYITKNGQFHLVLGKELALSTFFSKRHINKVKFTNSEAIIDGQFSLVNAKLQKASLMIKSRLSDYLIEVPMEKVVNIYANSKSGVTKFNYNVDIYQSLISFLQFHLDNEDVIDVFLNIDIEELLNPIQIKVGCPRIIAEYILKGEIITEYQGDIRSATPYFTMKGKNLSFHINTYDIDSYQTYLQCLRDNTVNKKQSDVWIIGERPYKAQENGYHFFKYMRTEHPELAVYYVIDKDSKERHKVEPFGNIIDFGSAEHFKMMLQADYICTTHYPELIYPTNSKIFEQKITATKVFLQHGVLGTKNLSGIYGNQLKNCNLDVFITSSQREKEIVVKDLKFDAEQVKVTGLARFDSLFEQSTTVKNQVLIIPTWRDWLTSADQIRQSEYLSRMNALLNSDIIKRYSHQGLQFVFCLHPNMQPFIDLFEVPDYVKSIRQGDVDVQQLIKESKLMINDYSSVGFDFSFLNKPVIYYQYDKDRFLGKHPSHIDIENELPGFIVNNQQDLEMKLQEMIDHHFEVPAMIKQRALNFYNFRDQQNCERIYQAAISYNKPLVNSKVKHNVITAHLYKRFQKLPQYYKLMKKMNALITKVVPVQQDLIVIESNVGKSVSDSPKVIYDALKSYTNKYRIVWVTNVQYPFNDERVITVKRLSPEYYYYLSRAKYWINNQNFPTYMKKHKDTIYLQTWHGTPLKKMLNDVEHFKGRTDDYKERVNQAIKTWDYLVSPSPYATQCFKSAFNYKKEILEVGYPRNDMFYNTDDRFVTEKQLEVRQRLGIAKDKKVILYAPTFRDDEVNKAKKHIINLKLDLAKMKENLADDYVLLLRPHIIISNALRIDQELQDFVINVGKYNDISELYLISDICITDYSSVMFDYANTKRPLLFFTYDLEHYKNDLRGFYFDFENEAPGPLLNTNEALIDAIINIEQVKKNYKDKYQDFYHKFCTFETGKAAQDIVKRIFE
ncbi:CDP-glycerol glycerophosphotransferase family protein [Staphylococcus simiae]|uniref:CDP-glycerol glycerophosphotransferase family protein n=1 Tax=Staphylococcus simiae TaxID=308354 RepID=UPI001A979703|nr:CDP-glycerol glycerophosphotransferase family protein [Staphylococcus simiae]MBO1199753.1 CDP-glycerol glycerophosphotransferase family protein [Staphylococcus simiae]MBO1201859.1 CDP-glycerol glycerophosphotransferase family protein [Staphylococcus simiae]MBO1204073.1 CDP-glycerol glycerophosphotransferase family protein [Staphylococcus simiae]MBO1211117.1 CDP-glycerol glycerophosphotransferase family protein [Staphylococcus simiae]MBO1230313.1 CDP-glycerol glycerophosphotransferase family